MLNNGVLQYVYKIEENRFKIIYNLRFFCFFFCSFMMSFEQDSEFMADVKFKLNRLNYVRKHEAVDNSIDMMQVLFPNAMIHVGNQHRISNRE